MTLTHALRYSAGIHNVTQHDNDVYSSTLYELQALIYTDITLTEAFYSTLTSVYCYLCRRIVT